MKTLKILCMGLVLTLICLKTSAQSLDVPGVAPIIRPSTTALMRYHTVPKFTVIQSRNQQYLISAEGLKHMKADWVTTTKILRDSVSVKRYGTAAAKGVAVCVLDDTEHPDAYITLKPWLTPFKPKATVN